MTTSTLRRPQTRRCCADREAHPAHTAWRGIMAFPCPGRTRPVRSVWPQTLQWMTSREVADTFDLHILRVPAFAREHRLAWRPGVTETQRLFRRDEVEALKLSRATKPKARTATGPASTAGAPMATSGRT